MSCCTHTQEILTEMRQFGQQQNYHNVDPCSVEKISMFTPQRCSAMKTIVWHIKITQQHSSSIQSMCIHNDTNLNDEK